MPLTTSLRVRVTLSIAFSLLLILGVFTGVEYARHRRILLDNLSLLASHSGKVIENTLRKEMLVSNFAEVQTILDTIGNTDEFRIVYLLNTSGEVIFAPDSAGVGTRLENDNAACQPCHGLPPDARPDSIVVVAEDGQRVFRSMQPIENEPECSQCHDPNDRLIGLLLTDIPTEPLEATLAVDLRENLLWWAGTILVTIIIVNFVMSRMVVQRIEGLTRSMTSFGEGSLHLRHPSDNPDEIGQLATAFNQMGQRIENEVAENRALSEHLRRQSAQRGQLLKRLITAQEDERKRVARELHDDLGQALGALALQIEVTERLIHTHPEQAIEQLRQIKEQVTETTDHMYELILALRPAMLDDLGLEAALRSHADRFLNGTGIAFDIKISGLSGRLDPEIETALYRIFQEALTNVVRHSNAGHVRIRLSRHDSTLEGEVIDDGQGFDLQSVQTDGATSRGLGLLGMQERVNQCGGTLEILSHPGRGTQIQIRIPMMETLNGC